MALPPEISVVVPVKDREALVAESVRSALAQEGCRLEVIVVDDRSRDGTREAVLRIGDPRVRLLAGSGRGPAAARNVGLGAARAPLAAFLDSDDLFEKEKLARQLSLLDRRPDAGLAYTGHVFFGGATRPERPERSEDRLADGFERLFLRPYFLTSSVVVRRDLIEKVGPFDEALPLGEDYDFYLRCAAAAGVVGDPAPLVRIRRHAGNLTAADRLRLAFLLKRVVRRHLPLARRLAREGGLPAGLVSRRLARLDYAIGALLLERGLRARARGYFAKARERRPFWVKAWKGTVSSLFR
jgi:glycosyltransferase involved in cell wall biosynthesis